ncbi:Crp/Fnr family transcriptional regulator [Candidatus Acetothermia bacterium]|nr:Crp/Fnr family transcriptional regulator [Candidatus Acetothermia bacterium]
MDYKLSTREGTDLHEEVAQLGQRACCPDQTNYYRGEVILAPGDRGGALYYIQRGKVKLVYRDENARRLTLAILGKGELFGETTLVGSETCPLWAEAWTDCCLCEVSWDRLRESIAQHPQLSLQLMKLIVNHEQMLLQRLGDLFFRSAPVRLACQLLELGQRFGRRTSKGLEIAIKHKDLADLCGIYRETASTILSQMALAKLLRSQQGQIVLLNLEGLAQVAAQRHWIPYWASNRANRAPVLNRKRSSLCAELAIGRSAVL